VCSTAKTNESTLGEAQPDGEHFVNMAHSLIEAGVPMVVAINHDLSIAAAHKLSKRFYSSVIKYGKRVDQAVRE
jgi:CHAT domain